MDEYIIEIMAYMQNYSHPKDFCEIFFKNSNCCGLGVERKIHLSIYLSQRHGKT